MRSSSPHIYIDKLYVIQLGPCTPWYFYFASMESLVSADYLFFSLALWGDYSWILVSIHFWYRYVYWFTYLRSSYAIRINNNRYWILAQATPSIFLFARGKICQMVHSHWLIIRYIWCMQIYAFLYTKIYRIKLSLLKR